MRTRLLLIGIFILMTLPACRRLDSTLPDLATEQPKVTTGAQAPEPSPTKDVAPEAGAIASEGDGSESRNEAAEADSLPEPALFDTSWDDREIFRAGLLETEQAVLDSLAGASVYHIDLTIDEPAAVSGQMQVRYTNQEGIPLDEIYFHLFPNQLGGSITVADVTVNGEAIQPEVTETAMRVPMASALEPGEAVVVQMDFVTTVPPEEESTKYNILAFNEDILALAHFYPMIAVYDDQAWHTESSPPHGDETYADMSYYLVRMTAPAEQVIATTGVEVDRSAAGSSQTVTVAAGLVRDFYVAMSDRYGLVSADAGAVRINSYAPRELLDGAELVLDVASRAIESFNGRFGPYPYSELDIVSTPTQALGIEYPGIFANAIRIYDLSGAASSGLPNAILLESTTVHEAAHQWFYNLVGNDQLNEPWLDEATSQYATWMYYVDQYGEENAAGFYQSLQDRWARLEFADIPVGLPAEDYSGQEYGAIVYGRGPIFLAELAQEMGQERFDAFLRDYSERFRWQIATSEAFQALAEEHCQCDLAPLFDAAVYAR